MRGKVYARGAQLVLRSGCCGRDSEFPKLGRLSMTSIPWNQIVCSNDNKLKIHSVRSTMHPCKCSSRSSHARYSHSRPNPRILSVTWKARSKTKGDTTPTTSRSYFRRRRYYNRLYNLVPARRCLGCSINM